MSDLIAHQVGATGHAAAIVQKDSARSLYDRAGGGIQPVNWGFIAELEAEADKMLEEFESLCDKDPEGAAYSNAGKVYLCKYGFLMDEKSGYPYRFHSHDIILTAPWILAQLVAEEYFEDGPEASPYTPEAFIGFDFSGNGWRQKKALDDPFHQDPTKRPDVTVELVGEGSFNINPSKTIRIKPAEGFIEHGS